MSACEVCEGTGHRLLVHVVAEVVGASPIPCAGPEGKGCPIRYLESYEAKEQAKWSEWERYLRAREAARSPEDLEELVEANLGLRRWRGRYHDRQPLGSVVVGDHEAAWLTGYVRVAREQPRGHAIDDSELLGIAAVGRRCSWDFAQAAPDPSRFRRELAESKGRRDAAAQARSLAGGMVP